MLSKASENRNETLWFVSYSDLITAILAVLVLMMSFSKIDLEKMDHANRLMRDGNLVTLPTLKKSYDRIIAENDLQKLVNVELKDEGLTIRTASTVQFATDSAVLDKKGIARLRPIMQKLIEDSRVREITIVGHTDDTGTDEHNWRLSSQRALAVLLHLLKQGLVSEHARLVAFGSHRPLKDVEKATGKQKKKWRALNRRVTIVIGRSVSPSNTR